MSRIEHPNIVKVFDQPVIGGIPYLAMEYVRGRNLDQIIRQAHYDGDEISLAFALTSLAEVLRGLAFVHRLKDSEGNALGVVHQDMTPSNVMISFFGEVKITDFGISYVTSRDGGLRKGVLKGKPRYVAPEVLAGKRVNNRADIYGVGVIFYELLTGDALFARTSVKQTLSAVARNELPNFQEKFSKLGSGVIQIFEKSLKKDPQERYRTAEEMAADVLSELTKVGGPIPSATIGYKTRRLFKEDPDVPEMDPALDEAILKGQQPISVAQPPPDLAQTLEAIDQLIGPESVDLFTLPPELQGELEDLEDGAPFAALTPIPDFVWEAKNDEELLRKAEEAFGDPSPIPLSVLPEPLNLRKPVVEQKAPSSDITAEEIRSRSTRNHNVGTYSKVKPQTPTPSAKPHLADHDDNAHGQHVNDAEESGRSNRFLLGLALGATVGICIGAAFTFLFLI